MRCTVLIVGVLMSLPASGEVAAAQSTRVVPERSNATPTADADRVLSTQVALDRAGFSSGEIDGKSGGNTKRALRAFQQAQGLTPTGELDTVTAERLGTAFQNPLSTYTISAEDVAGPFTERIPADMMQKSQLPALGYTSVRELLGERFHVSPALLTRLNPNAEFKQGEVIRVPNVEPFVVSQSGSAGRGKNDAVRAGNANAGRGPVARATATPPTDLVVTVTAATETLEVQDGSGNVIFHAPVTVGSTHDPLPVGEWKVNGVDRNPSFNYNPDLFWDANPSHSKAKIAAGPNNPVGSVWIDLSKEHYGIHGTPEPSRIGYTESHGCIRLTNWDAERLASLVKPGTKVVLR